MTRLPTPAIQVKERSSGPVFYAVWRDAAKRQIWRAVGPAWIDRDELGKWRKRPGRVPPGYYDERQANVEAAALVEQYEALAAQERDVRAKGVTFREVAHAYLDWLQRKRGAKPSTLRQHHSDLAEPGVMYLRGRKTTNGYIIGALGDRPCSEVTTLDIDTLLDSIAETGVKAKTVNRYRQIVCAVFNFGVRSSKFQLSHNPASMSERRHVPASGPLIFYTPAEVEDIATTFEAGLHREVHERHGRECASRREESCNCTPTFRARGEAFDTLADARNFHRDHRPLDEVLEDHRDAEAVRVSAYTGLRQGELLELRWSDVDWDRSVLTISRAVSAKVESTTKSGRVRQVPLSGRAARALSRLRDRGHYTSADDLVFCNILGGRLDESALRRRFTRAQEALGVRRLRWHDLRHTFGSQLAAKGLDLVTIQSAMGHAHIQTTSVYLHARPAHELAAAFDAAFEDDDR